MIYLFDSNIVLHYVRQSDLMKNIEQNFDPFGVGNESWLCVVSKGELRSIAIQNQWGKTRILGAKLLTSDADFDHLEGVYLDLLKIKV